jgi:ribosomal-protein-alanine N-acetyltransferase
MGIIFSTKRLQARLAAPSDAGLIYRLWTDPRVMTFVGFPHGIKVTREEIRKGIIERGEDQFRQLLVIELLESRQAIGHCQLGVVDEAGIVEPDVKLLPEFWGLGYGREVFQAMVDYLFAHTDCIAVATTPNRENLASIKMVEAAGGVKAEEGVWEPPEELRGDAIPVPYAIYKIYRKDV